jgi:hypothetical protein
MEGVELDITKRASFRKDAQLKQNLLEIIPNGGIMPRVKQADKKNNTQESLDVTLWQAARPFDYYSHF